MLDTNAPTALVSNMHDPEKANFIFWWVLYPVESDVYIQNQILFLNELKIKLSIDNLFEHIHPRSTVTDEGVAISEWVSSKQDIAKFLAQPAGQNT